MPTDIRLTEDQGLTFDDTGDLATVSGNDNVVQQVSIRILDNADAIRGEPLTPRNREVFKDDVSSALDDLSYVDDVVEITLKRNGDETTDVTIKTLTDEFTQTV